MLGLIKFTGRLASFFCGRRKMNNYIKLIQEALNDLQVPHVVVNDDVINIKRKDYYIGIYELEWNKYIMTSGTYNEHESDTVEFTMNIYPMQYYNFKELFKLWFIGNDNVISAYFEYRDKTDYE